MRPLILRLSQLLLFSAVLLPLALRGEPRQKAGQKYLPEGQFVWHEILSANPDQTAKFYASVFDWKLVPAPVSEPDEKPYLLLQTEGQLFAGIAAAPEGTKKARWTCWVQVPDADNIAASAVSAGGLVVRPAREHLIGRVIEVADPGQARFTLVQLNIRQPYVALPPIIWHRGTTYPAAGTADFYHRLANWNVSSEEDGQMQILVAEHRTADLQVIKPESDTTPGWLPCFQVDDLRRSIARAVSEGAQQIQAPADDKEHGRIAKLTDPQGAEFWLVQR